jgi:hypothetical protein
VPKLFLPGSEPALGGRDWRYGILTTYYTVFGTQNNSFVGLDGCEDLCLAKKEGHCLRVFLNRVVKTNDRPKWKEITGVRKQLIARSGMIFTWRETLLW